MGIEKRKNPSAKRKLNQSRWFGHIRATDAVLSTIQRRGLKTCRRRGPEAVPSTSRIYAAPTDTASVGNISYFIRNRPAALQSHSSIEGLQGCPCYGDWPSRSAHVDRRNIKASYPTGAALMFLPSSRAVSGISKITCCAAI